MLYRDKDDGTVYTLQQIADEFDMLQSEYPTIYSYPLYSYISKYFDEIENKTQLEYLQQG